MHIMLIIAINVLNHIENVFISQYYSKIIQAHYQNMQRKQMLHNIEMHIVTLFAISLFSFFNCLRIYAHIVFVLMWSYI